MFQTCALEEPRGSAAESTSDPISPPQWPEHKLLSLKQASFFMTWATVWGAYLRVLTASSPSLSPPPPPNPPHPDTKPPPKHQWFVVVIPLITFKNLKVARLS